MKMNTAKAKQVPLIGRRAKILSPNTFCEYLWNAEGILTKFHSEKSDNHNYLLTFNPPIPSPAEGWPAIECLWVDPFNEDEIHVFLTESEATR